MNLINSGVTLEWTTTLRHMAAGATIAAVLIVQPSPSPSIRIQGRSSGEHVRLVTSVPDGLSDIRTVRFQTRAGLDLAFPLIDQSVDELDDPTLLPLRLREVSSLPVTTLAQLAGVSKVTYHNWLKGEGISEANSTRLAYLLETLRELREIRGEKLGEFLETRSGLGQPLELLQRGDADAVIGLALQPGTVAPPPPSIQDDIWEESGLQGWIQPVASLNWDAPRLADAQLAKLMMEANPPPWNGAEAAMDESDESPFVAHVRFVS